jgi:hypothetical protein
MGKGGLKKFESCNLDVELGDGGGRGEDLKNLKLVIFSSDISNLCF